MTVSSGTIHGLILYASIVNANSAVFGLQDLCVRGITVFLEGLNLNFGIETCFYMGLNQLQYTGWQFVFPIYLWATGRPGDYSLPFFCEGLKIFEQYQPSGSSRYRALILLFLPYTFVLLFAQQLEKNRHVSRLLNRLRITPFIQAYQAPYKPGSRYWVGLCLFLRCIILVTIGTSGNENNGLLATSLVCILIVSIIGISGGIYTKRWHDALEISYILNLGLFTVTTYHLKLAYQPNEREHVIAYISITVALITFIGVVTKQCYTQITKTQWFVKVKNKLIRNRDTDTQLTDSQANSLKKDSVVIPTQLVFTDNTQMELREPMLDYIY